MPLAVPKPKITARALGGHFAVLASEPSARFYNELRERGAEGLKIRWAWFCMVHFAVGFVVQGASSENVKNLEQTQGWMIEVTKACGVNTDQDLNEIESRLSVYRQLVSRQASFLEIGEVLSEHVGIKDTNPIILFQLGQALSDLLSDIRFKFAFFEVQ